MKLSRTSLCAPSGILLLSFLTAGTSLLPWLLFKGKNSWAWFSQLREQTQCPCEPKCRAWWWKCLLWGHCWCAASPTRMVQLAELSLGHHQHRAEKELFAENFGCGTGEEKVCDFCKLSSNLHLLLWTLSLPDSTSGFSLVWCAARRTSASLNLIKALPSASAEAHCNPRLGGPPEGSLFIFPDSLHCSLRKKGLANWPTANRPLKDPCACSGRAILSWLLKAMLCSCKMGHRGLGSWFISLNTQISK